MRKNGSDSTKLLKKNDVLLILFFFIAGIAAFGWLFANEKAGNQVLVTSNGEEYGRYSLEEDREVNIEKEGWHNQLVIREGYVRMEDADCPDKICVHHAKINKVGETIVCLPHKLVVEIVDSQSGAGEKDFDSFTK